MAIDLFCYTTDSSVAVEQTVDLLKKTHQGLFFERFLISDVRDVTAVGKQMALDFGLAAKCLFLVRLNDKGASDLISTVTFVLKTTFGIDKLLILHEGETPI